MRVLESKEVIKVTHLTDEELLALLAAEGGMTPIEAQLAARLARAIDAEACALDELAECKRVMATEGWGK